MDFRPKRAKGRRVPIHQRLGHGVRLVTACAVRIATREISGIQRRHHILVPMAWPCHGMHLHDATGCRELHWMTQEINYIALGITTRNDVIRLRFPLALPIRYTLTDTG